MLYSIRLFLRKDITANSIIVLALLVAILASATSIVNFLVSQADAIGNLVNPSETIIVSCGRSLMEFNLSPKIVGELGNLSYVRALVPQSLFGLTLLENLEAFMLWLEVSRMLEAILAHVGLT